MSDNEYRPSASLILAARHPPKAEEKFDYSLLLIERTEHTSYTLNHCVFPGGVFDAAADEATAWLTYLDECGVTTAHLELLNSRQRTGRPHLMSAGVNFTRDISLRLTALRETFEEVGLLLCRPRDSLKDLASVSQPRPAQLLRQPCEAARWQQRVHDDARQFLELCRHFQVIPDLWALMEWSVWRTTATANARRKYDTVYYLAALESTDSPLLLEANEVASAHWLQPHQCWLSSSQGLLWLPYMLLYETCRLMNVHSWQRLVQFAWQRSLLGCTLLQPVYYRCDDCLFAALPGDELYVAQPDKCTETIIVSGSIGQLMAHTRRQNRYIIFDFHKVVLATNVQPLDGHMPPQTVLNVNLCKL